MALSQSEVRRRIGAAMGAQPFSVSRAMQQLWEGGLRPGTPERDTCQELAERAGVEFDANRIHLPLSTIGVRDMTASGSAGSQYLVAADTLAPVNVANGLSVAADSGAVIMGGMVGNAAIPRITARPATSWLGDENTQITEGQPTVGIASATPKAVAAYVEGTRQMRVQAPELADQVLQRELSAAAWLAIDSAAVAGPGSAGAPLGIVGTSGVDVRSGTTLSWATVCAMRQAVTAAGGRNISFWSGPAAQTTLSTRERFAGAGAIWGDAGIAGRPSYATPAAADATLLCADFTRLMILIWGTPRLELNPYGPGFSQGFWSARLIVNCDVVVTVPACFSIAQSIT